MRPYEVMVIFDADLDDDVIKAALERSLEHLRKGGAEIGRVDTWGKRRFAFELNHRWEGFYVVFRARAEPSGIEEFSRTLTLADEVIRHRVVVLPESVYSKLHAAAGA